MADEPETPAEVVDSATEEVPEEVVTPEPEHHENHDDKVIDAIERMGDRIIETLNAAKEASPVTPAEEEVLDASPIRKPWTHRSPFRRND